MRSLAVPHERICICGLACLPSNFFEVRLLNENRLDRIDRDPRKQRLQMSTQNRPGTILPRREILRSMVAGSLLMPGLISEMLASETGGVDSQHTDNPLAARPGHFEA